MKDKAPETEPINPNLELWNGFGNTDPKFTKPITGKSYSGDSPNPTYVMRKLTEAFGPIGRDWGITVVDEQIVDTIPHKLPNGDVGYEKMHYIRIRFWFLNGDGRTGTFEACGGTPLVRVTVKGRWMHDEDAPKKSLTDAYTKGASWLGVCSDIFLGLYDDRYSNEGGEDLEPPRQSTGEKPKPTSSISSSPW